MTKEELAALLKALRAGLCELLDDRLEAVYLYGSQARGDARPGSDIDVLIVLRGEFDYFEMMGLTSELAWKLSLENDVVVSRVFVSKESFDQANTSFLLSVQREAVPI